MYKHKYSKSRKWSLKFQSYQISHSFPFDMEGRFQITLKSSHIWLCLHTAVMCLSAGKYCFSKNMLKLSNYWRPPFPLKNIWKEDRPLCSETHKDITHTDTHTHTSLTKQLDISGADPFRAPSGQYRWKDIRSSSPTKFNCTSYWALKGIFWICSYNYTPVKKQNSQCSSCWRDIIAHISKK